MTGEPAFDGIPFDTPASNPFIGHADTPPTLHVVDPIPQPSVIVVARSHGLTDAAQAERFASTFADQLRFDNRRETWFAWSGRQWREDVVGLRYQLAISLARNLLVMAAAEPELEARKKVVSFALACESRSRLDSVLYLARYQPPIADAGDAWDLDPWLLGTPDGVIDLRTGLIRRARPDDMMLLSTGVVPAAIANCQRWERFLFEVFDGDGEIVAWLRRVCGYLLTGDTSEQFFIVAHGAGSNGKSTLLNVLAHVLGSYAYNLPFSALELHARTSIPNDLAALVGRRLVTASESGESVRLNESRIKMLSGGDPVTARFLHAEFFEFSPVAKFVLATNAKPVIRDDSHGMWRRVRLLPFTRTFPNNRALQGELQAEGPAILRWMIDGCLEWQRDGLQTPRAVEAATKVYRADSDTLQQFIDARCELCSTSSVRAGVLFAAYKTWYGEQDFAVKDRLNQRQFGSKIRDRFDAHEDRSGVQYIGVGLR